MRLYDSRFWKPVPRASSPLRCWWRRTTRWPPCGISRDGATATMTSSGVGSAPARALGRGQRELCAVPAARHRLLHRGHPPRRRHAALAHRLRSGDRVHMGGLVAVARRRGAAAHRAHTDLHDGLAQELAFIANQVALVERGATSSNSMEQVGAAARRALTVRRRAIRAPCAARAAPLEVALAHVAEEVALPRAAPSPSRARRGDHRRALRVRRAGADRERGHHERRSPRARIRGHRGAEQRRRLPAPCLRRRDRLRPDRAGRARGRVRADQRGERAATFGADFVIRAGRGSGSDHREDGLVVRRAWS